MLIGLIVLLLMSTQAPTQAQDHATIEAKAQAHALLTSCIEVQEDRGGLSLVGSPGPTAATESSTTQAQVSLSGHFATS